jgi:hypothetical protein
MKRLSLILTILLPPALLQAQESCLTDTSILALDQQWEQAMMNSEVEFIDQLLADEFIWIHNHADFIDTRASLLERSADPNLGATGDVRSRISNDRTVHRLENTAVVKGFTVVDRGPSPTKYAFMRTYVETGNGCKLLANQTMAVPEQE